MPQVLGHQNAANDDIINERAYSNVDAAREDREAAISEDTGSISQREIDDLGGQHVINSAPGVQTRHKKLDTTKADRNVDEAVRASDEYDYATGGQRQPESRRR